MKFPSHLSTSDLERPQLYWSNRSQGKHLERLNTDGSLNKIILPETSQVKVGEGIAYFENWMYFINDSFPNKVCKCRLNGSGYQVLVSDSGTGSAQITVCADGIFWGEYLNGNQKINRADLDGSNVTTIHTVYGVINTGLDNDGINIYYIEQNFNSGVRALKRMDFDGTNITTIISQSNLENGSVARDLDVIGNHIYWVNQGGTNINARIMRSDKSGNNITTIVTTNVAADKGFFSLRVGASEIYYLVAFGSTVDEGVYKCNLDGTGFPNKLIGGEPYPYCLELA